MHLITAMAGGLGSLVGGSATLATAWITQKTTTKRELVKGLREACREEFSRLSARL